MYICRVAKALPQPVDLDSFFRERITRTDQICVRILQNCSFSVNLQSYWIHIDYRGLEKLVGTPSLLLSSPPPLPQHPTLLRKASVAFFGTWKVWNTPPVSHHSLDFRSYNEEEKGEEKWGEKIGITSFFHSTFHSVGNVNRTQSLMVINTVY